MKRCPTCNRTYADETLTYCLADGALLSAPYPPEAPSYIPTRITNPPPTEVLPSNLAGHYPLSPKRSPVSIYLIIGVLSLILVGGIVGWLNLRTKDTPPISQDTRNASSTQPVSSDAQINSFTTEINTFTDELVQKVESAPNPSQGVDDAQQYLDSRKAELVGKFNSVKHINGNQVSEETKKRMQDSFYQDGVKVGQLTAKYGSDPAVKLKLKKLTQDFLDIFKM